MIETALRYARSGIYVFPLAPGTKFPQIPKAPPNTRENPGKFGNGRGYHDATTSESLLRAWWDYYPNADIGIALAKSDLAVLDIDVGEGKRGMESLAKLQEHIGPIPDTYLVRTGGGGLHYYFKAPEDCPKGRHSDFLHKAIDGAGKDSNIDIFTDGFVVAPPSKHESGRRYEYISGSSVLPLPRALAKVFTAPLREVVERREVEEHVEIGAGSRDSQLWKLAISEFEKGLPFGLVQMTVHAANELYCKPPMTTAEVERVLSSAQSQAVPVGDWFADLKFAESILPLAVQRLQTEITTDGRLSITPGQALDRVQQHGYELRPYPTGFDGVDGLLGGGYLNRRLTLVIAPPGDGKSAFVIQQAIDHEGPSLYVSSELSSEEVMFRIAAHQLGKPWGELMQSGAHEAIKDCLKDANVYIVGAERLRDGSQSLEQKLTAIALEIHRLSEETGQKPLVIIDYLQNLVARERDSNVAVGKLSEMLTNLALSPLDCPIVAVSACSRLWYGAHPDIEHAGGFMAAAKESGNLDFDAAAILYLEVSQEMRPTGEREARIAVAKSRFGYSGFVGAVYNGRTGGQWREDNEVLAGFEKSAAAERALKEQFEIDEKRVKQRIRDFGGDPINVLIHNCGIASTRARRAIHRLLEAGELEKQRVSRIDEFNRAQNVDIVAFPKAPVPDSKEPVSLTNASDTDMPFRLLPDS